MKKTLGILSKSRDMADFYAGLLSGLFGGTAEIYASSLEDGSIRKLRDCDLYLVSVTSYDLIYHSWAKGFLPPEARTVQASVTFSMKAVETLRAYPEGTKALLVNQTRHMAMESISQLYHLGISNIEFLPCYPGSENPPEVLTVFTPGEADLAPAGAAVVDLGPRSLTANTVCEIALRLGNPVFLESREFAAYTAALAGVDYSLQTLTYNSLTMESKLELILNALDAGIVCVDEEGLVTLVNRAAEEQLCSSREQLLGRPAAEALPELPFADGPRLASILGRDFSVTTAPLYIRERSLGTFAVLRPFQEVEEQQATLRLQKTPKSHHAKYTFHDIEGTSPAIRKTREIARRVAAPPSCWTGRAAPERSSSPRLSTTPPPGGSGPLSPSTVRRCRRRCWRASSLAMRTGPSPEPGRAAGRASSSAPTRGRCSWMRSRPSAPPSRPSSSGCSRSRRWSESVP